MECRLKANAKRVPILPYHQLQVATNRIKRKRIKAIKFGKDQNVLPALNQRKVQSILIVRMDQSQQTVESKQSINERDYFLSLLQG